MGAGEGYYKEFLRTAKGKLTPDFYADLRNVRKGIGWRPTTDIKTGIKKTVNEFLNSKS